MVDSYSTSLRTSVCAVRRTRCTREFGSTLHHLHAVWRRRTSPVVRMAAGSVSRETSQRDNGQWPVTRALASCWLAPCLDSPAPRGSNSATPRMTQRSARPLITSVRRHSAACSLHPGRGRLVPEPSRTTAAGPHPVRGVSRETCRHSIAPSRVCGQRARRARSLGGMLRGQLHSSRFARVARDRLQRSTASSRLRSVAAHTGSSRPCGQLWITVAMHCARVACAAGAVR